MKKCWSIHTFTSLRPLLRPKFVTISPKNLVSSSALISITLSLIPASAGAVSLMSGGLLWLRSMLFRLMSPRILDVNYHILEHSKLLFTEITGVVKCQIWSPGFYMTFNSVYKCATANIKGIKA